MKSRTVLQEKTSVCSSNREYEIQKVIGDGATSIVYVAVYRDSLNYSHTVLLKECFPYLSVIERQGSSLIWSAQEQREKDLSAFKETYSKLMKFQNEDSLKNSMSPAYDIFEQNNTYYIVFDITVGASYDTIDRTSLSLKDILEVGLSLTKVVGHYHKMGYLHLDVKPSNFLVIPETNQLIKLFDIDTVTKREDILSSPAITYSDGYAAPEQMLKQRNRICESTDIYAIGAIIFEKIFGRRVANSDSSFFAKWSYEGHLFNGVNPKVKRLLTNFFHKTLAANANRRYRSSTLLQDALDELLVCVNNKTCVSSKFPSPVNNFIGRDEELSKIANSFKNKKNIVFLHGDVGGIGKSELAKKYAVEHENDYDAILFLNYKGSLKDMIASVNISNTDDCKNEVDQKIGLFFEVCQREKVLLILDNFDVLVEYDDYLLEFQELSADIIITTRTDFSDTLSEKSEQIEIPCLTEKQLFTLFEEEAGRTLTTDEDKACLKKLLRLIQYHTLLTTLLAKQLSKSGISVSQLLLKTENGLTSFSDAEQIVTSQNGRIIKAPIIDILRSNFRICELDEVQKKVLVVLYIVLDYESLTKVKFRKYAEMLGAENVYIDALNDLIEIGYIKLSTDNMYRDKIALSIHPLISEMINLELKPMRENNSVLDTIVNNLLPSELTEERFEGFDDLSTLRKTQIQLQCEYLCALIYSLMKRGYEEDATRILWNCINGNIFTVDELFGSNQCSYVVINVWFNYIKYGLRKLKENSEANNYIKYYTNSCLLAIETCESDYLNTENRQRHIKNTVELFDNCISSIDNLPTNDNELILWRICKPIIQRLSHYVYEKDRDLWKDSYLKLKKYEATFNERLGDLSCDWDRNINPDKIRKNEESLSSLTKEESEEDKDDRRIFLRDGELTEKYYQMLMHGNTADEIANDIINEPELTNNEKLQKFENIAQRFFFLQSCGDMVTVRKNIAQKPWRVLSQLLDKAKDFYLDTDEFNDNTGASHNNDECNVYRAVCFGYLEGNSHNCKTYCDYVIEQFFDEVRHTLEKYPDADYFLAGVDFSSFDIGSLFSLFRELELCHVALPYLVECTERVHEIIKKRKDYDEVIMFDLYKDIVEFANEADNFTNAEDEENLYCRDILYKYSTKIETYLPSHNLKLKDSDDFTD